MHSRKTLLHHWESALTQSGVDSPRLSAQVLLAHVLGISRLDMLLDAHAPVNDEARSEMDRLGFRRCAGEPVAYLTGRKEFYGLDFEVDPAVLIPRPETELILDDMRRTLAGAENLRVLDVGTGSGALAVSCAVLFPGFRVAAVDISLAALRVAKRNAAAHGVGDRVSFVHGDLVQALRLSRFDVIMANLPYVPEATMAALSPEVVGHEPRLALFSGPDGLDCYRALAASLAGRVKPGSRLWCEIGATQGAAMKALFSGLSRRVDVLQDYAGHDRMVAVVF